MDSSVSFFCIIKIQKTLIAKFISRKIIIKGKIRSLSSNIIRPTAEEDEKRQSELKVSNPGKIELMLIFEVVLWDLSGSYL